MRSPAAPLKRRRRSRRCAGPWFVTPHAVERYIARVRPGLAYDVALWELAEQSRGAHFVKLRRDGHELWRGPKPRRLRFIVGHGGGDKPQLVTVLFAFDRDGATENAAC